MMRIGIVGLPNVGKSTLFKALTRKQVNIANYPFCTIEPNVGVVEVPDERLAKLAAVSKSQQIIPAVIEFVDIAGLVAGAHKGEGLGNQFLAAIREVDAIVHIVRVFNDPNVVHVSNAINPENDIATITLELVMADLATVEKRREALKTQLKAGAKKEILVQQAAMEKVWQALNAGQPAQTAPLADEELPLISDLHLLTMKPIILVMNCDEEKSIYCSSEVENQPNNDFSTRPASQDSLEEYIPIIPLCAKLEAELADLPPEEAKNMMAELGLPESGLSKLIRTGYQLLGLITFLTSGEKETRAWTVPRGTKAPAAAGVIHTDFEKGFIRAEITDWQDFVAYGETGAKERGLTRIEGKEYEMKDGDTCYFRIAA